jgi:DNA primase catalytic core
MARVPDEEIERLKKAVSVERLAEARGVKLRRHGADLHGLCPFHEDREPSLVITPEKNLWHCLGACQAGGSAIDWVMRAESVSFRHAVELLRKDSSSLVAVAPAAERPAKTAQKLPKVLARDATDGELLVRVADYYHATLKESPEALAYLAARGLEHPELATHFRLGFSNRTLGYRLPGRHVLEGETMRARLQTLGVMRESGHEHLSGSLVVPIFDAEGARVLGMYGRKITDRLRAGTPLHLYLPGPHRGVWNEQAACSSGEVVLCEALIDAMTFWCAGIRNVTTAYGVEGFTAEHLAAFERYGVRRVYLAFDRDAAGDRAAAKLGAELNAVGIETFRVIFPKGMDVNEYARKVVPASKSLELVIRKAEWMGKGAERANTNATACVPDGAGADVASVEPVVAAIDDVAARVELDANPSLVAVSSRPDEAAVPMSASPPSPAPRTGVVDPASSDVMTAASGDEVTFRFGAVRWRVRGLSRNTSYEQIRVNILVSNDEDGTFFVDALEMYAARQRASYLKQASTELGVPEATLRTQMGAVLLELEAKVDEQMKKLLAASEKTPVMNEAEREAALELLRDPKLCDRILADFERCGVVGEETNKLLGYVGAVSRKLEQPLAIVIQSSSAAGKSSLMDGILDFVPEEERVEYSAMTGQALYYLGEKDLRHKILAIAEGEGAERASYALKLLQSEGEISIASTGKDPQTGKLVTHEYRVSGPVMTFLTTTAIEIDEELLNRCVVLTVDEGREQTRRVHARQRTGQTLAGLLARRDKERVVRLHRCAQRLLRPLLVVNPFAETLSFSDARTRARRDHMKYLTMIRAVAFLHQHQREVKVVEHGGERVEYIEATGRDVELATRLAQETLGRNVDELPPVTRRVLGELRTLVEARASRDRARASDVRFTRREARHELGLSYEQLRVHLGRLVELEYVVAHRGSRGQSYVYELDDGGLGRSLGGDEGEFGVGYRGDTGPKPGSAGSLEDARGAEKIETIASRHRSLSENAQGSTHTNGASYAHARASGS